MKNGIISLDEVLPNTWRAKYQGNYGIYTIKITKDGQKTTKFSCSCPSDYYPCKHIAMIEDAIDEYITEKQKVTEKNKNRKTTPNIEKLLRHVPLKDLCKFVARQARNDKELTNAILLEFADKITTKNDKVKNSYSVILHNALNSVRVRDEEYYYYDEGNYVELDALDPISKKVRELFEQKNYCEAALVCKAWIEELAAWIQKKSKKLCEITDYIDYDYFEFPFKILGDIVEVSGVDLKELYDYCCVEIRKDKYNVSNIFTEFNNLFMFLALKVNPNGFIEFQDELLSKIDDMSSYDAARILEQKINLYNYNNQPEKAWEIIEGNIQIESFCKKLAEKKINEKKYAEAKKLINDYLNEKNDRHNSDWNKLLFKIAQQEKDIPMIRELSFGFIERQFEIKYFKVYKSTFTNKEWQTALQQLINHYENSLGGYHVTINMYKAYTFYNKSIFELLVAEGANERLMEFVEKYLSVELIEQYYENFVAKFPQKTLLLFRKALDDYAEKNTGHDAYNYLAQLLKKMQKIEGGKEIVKNMLKQYEILYKNRTSMRNMIKTF